jgi:hypothetical protein
VVSANITARKPGGAPIIEAPVVVPDVVVEAPFEEDPAAC